MIDVGPYTLQKPIQGAVQHQKRIQIWNAISTVSAGLVLI